MTFFFRAEFLRANGQFLEEGELEEAHHVFNELMLHENESITTLTEEITKLKSQIEQSEAQLRLLTHQRDTLSNYQYENRKKTAHLKKLIENKEEEQKRTLMEALQIRNAECNVAIQTVLECVRMAFEQTVHLCEEHSPSAFEECISFIQLPLNDYIQTEEALVQSIEQYALSKEDQNTTTVVTATMGLNFELITKELTRLQSAYFVSSQLELCTSQELARAKAISEYHTYQRPNSLPYETLSDQLLAERIDETKKRLAQTKRRVTELTETILPRLFRELSHLQHLNVVNANYRAKLAIQQTIFERQEKALSLLLNQQARLKLFEMAVKSELKSLHYLFCLLKALNNEVERFFASSQRRPPSNVQQSSELLFLDKFLQRLSTLLSCKNNDNVNSSMSLEEIFKCVKQLKENHSELQQRKRDFESLVDQEINSLRQKVEKLRELLYKETVSGLPSPTSKNLKEAEESTEKILESLSVSVDEIATRYQQRVNKLQEFSEEALIERNMWLYFYRSDPTEFRKLFGKHKHNTETESK